MAEVYGPPCPFRAVGFTSRAGMYPLSAHGQAIIAEHNGVVPDYLPRGARFSSGPYMHDWIERLGAAKAMGLTVRIEGRWLLPRELADIGA